MFFERERKKEKESESGRRPLVGLESRNGGKNTESRCLLDEAGLLLPVDPEEGDLVARFALSLQPSFSTGDTRVCGSARYDASLVAVPWMRF